MTTVLIHNTYLNYNNLDNHATLVQRQVGSKSGTGGSSGYGYLKATMDNRRKVFNDILDLATWIIPKEHLPKLK